MGDRLYIGGQIRWALSGNSAQDSQILAKNSCRTGSTLNPRVEDSSAEDVKKLVTQEMRQTWTETFGQNLRLRARQQLRVQHQRTVPAIGRVQMMLHVRVPNHGENLHGFWIAWHWAMFETEWYRFLHAKSWRILLCLKIHVLLLISHLRSKRWFLQKESWSQGNPKCYHYVIILTLILCIFICYLYQIRNLLVTAVAGDTQYSCDVGLRLWSYNLIPDSEPWNVTSLSYWLEKIGVRQWLGHGLERDKFTLIGWKIWIVW